MSNTSLLIFALPLLFCACGAGPVSAPVTGAATTPGEGLYVFHGDGAEGYIDGEGRVVIAPAFDLAHVFTEGLGLVFTPDQRKAGFIDATGAWVIPPRFDFARPFSDQRALAKDPETRRWGYIDHSGAWVIAPRYLRAVPFNEGRAVVELDDGSGAVIDPSGAQVFQLPGDADLSDPPRFTDGLMPIEREHEVQVVDRMGATVFAGAWEFCRGFSEGLAAVRHDGGWDFVDRSGAVVQGGYAFAWSYSEGLAAVTPPGEKRFGYVDRAGVMVIPPRFDRAYWFREGRAAVEVDGKVGYIDATGAWVIEPVWVSPQSSADHFRRGRAMVGALDGEGRLLRGYIDLAGKVVYPPGR